MVRRTGARNSLHNTRVFRQQMKKNYTIDLAAWGLTLVILLATPLLVNLLYTAPAQGPDKNPAILIMFLTFLGFLAVSTLALWGQILMGRTRSLSAPKSLAASTLNTMNLHNKLLGGLFILSGFVKLQDPIGFGIKLDDYWTVFAAEEYLGSLFPADFFRSISTGMAMLIAVFEVVLAFALMTGYRMRWAGTIVLLLMVFFTGLTAFSAITGEVTDCGCFGDALKLTPWQSFYKDIFLIVVTLPIFLLRKRIQPYFPKPIPMVAVILSALSFGYISYYCLNHLPLMDFRGPYKVGQNLQYNATTMDEEGVIIAHDFYEFCADCGKDSGYEGATLYFVCYDMEKYDAEDYEAAATLSRELQEKAPGIKVCGGTNTSSRVRKELGINGLEDLCLSGQDQKTLKTMIRSSPGYFFLKDGIVTKKWHHNDRPSVEELRELAGPIADQRPVVPEPEPAPLDSLTLDSLRQDSLNKLNPDNEAP